MVLNGITLQNRVPAAKLPVGYGASGGFQNLEFAWWRGALPWGRPC